MTGATTAWRGALAAISIAGLAACDAPTAPEVDGGEPGDASDDGGAPDPHALFTDEVEPLLVLRCEECHQGNVRAPEFLVAGDYEASVLAYPGLVVPGDPNASLLLQKGAHRGPEWSPTGYSGVSLVLGWGRDGGRRCVSEVRGDFEDVNLRVFASAGELRGAMTGARRSSEGARITRHAAIQCRIVGVEERIAARASGHPGPSAATR